MKLSNRQVIYTMVESVDPTPKPETGVVPFEVDIKILNWRRAQFVRMGFRPKVAVALSETQVDVWAARQLQDAGCSTALIIRLLVGLTRQGEEDLIHTLNWFLVKTANVQTLANALKEEDAVSV